MSDRSSTPEQLDAEAATCTLSESGERTRINWVRDELVPHYREADLLEDGFVATFDDSEESLVALARLLDKEAACCGSFTFEMIYEPPYDEVRVRITGPEGTRELVERGFIDEIRRADDPSL